jgi:uncharacterized Fe-S cluster-containing radical SAM superfamily protein
MAKVIETDKYSDVIRSKCINVSEQQIRVSRLADSAQAEDLSVPPNCGGLGRIRHFRRNADPDWVSDPLPIDPACRALNLVPGDVIRAQVFQSAGCNWRCWYCFVPFELLRASEKRSCWATASELLDLYLATTDRPPVLDLSGGQPDLVPEWVPWSMQLLRERQLEGSLFLWSDDNLSTDYFWTKLSNRDRELVATFCGYGRVGCFKGFDAVSFSFNTKAHSDLFKRQFDLMRRFVGTGIDLYAYATFTTPDSRGIDDAMKRFVDRLQDIAPNLPLRTVPLKIVPFRVSEHRLEMNSAYNAAIEHQRLAIDAWKNELEDRFSSEMRSLSIVDVPLK